jgi:Protein of unknown function (DUF5131)
MAGGAADAALKWVSFEPWISDMNAPLRKTSPNLRRMLRKNKIAWTMVGGESGLRDDTNLMTLEDARNLLEESKAAGSKVHFKQLGTALAIQRGVYSTRGNGEHRAKGGNPEQWPENGLTCLEEYGRATGVQPNLQLWSVEVLSTCSQTQVARHSTSAFNTVRAFRRTISRSMSWQHASSGWL